MKVKGKQESVGSDKFLDKTERENITGKRYYKIGFRIYL
jgi:hypothetical protein